jgi:hypothetical protein
MVDEEIMKQAVPFLFSFLLVLQIKKIKFCKKIELQKN